MKGPKIIIKHNFIKEEWIKLIETKGKYAL